MNLKKRMFVVSCQALPEEPMYGPGIPAKMVKAALAGGADAVRVSQIDNVRDVVGKFGVPVIGIIKKKHPGSDVFITPTVSELDELIRAGTPIIAVDATLRKRPQESLEELVAHFSKKKVSGQELMADCSDLEDIANADRLGFDYISTTLRGYTASTKGRSNTENDCEFLRAARKATKRFLVAEGGLNTPEQAAQASGIVDAVVVGSAITRPDFITRQFAAKLGKGAKNE